MIEMIEQPRANPRNNKKHMFYSSPKARGGGTNIILSKAIDGFLQACYARKLSPHTIDDYSRTLRRFLAHCGDVVLREITTSQVSAFLAALGARVGEKTLLNCHIGLAALWTWAIRESHTQKHIIQIVERPKPQKIVIVPFTEQEVRSILEKGQEGRNALRNRCIFLLLVDTGMRASEFCGLAHADIDLINRRLKVLGKGNKQRILPFSKRTAQALFEYLSSIDTAGSPFKLNRTSLAQFVRRVGGRAGIRDVHPHRFRHTFAVTYLRNGGDPYTLQEILGHSTLDMVKTYLAIAQIDIESAHLRASPVENWQL